MSGGICSAHLVSSHTLGTGDVLLFLLLLGAVTSKNNVFFVVIDDELVYAGMSEYERLVDACANGMTIV